MSLAERKASAKALRQTYAYCSRKPLQSPARGKKLE
jgi:hypothetical protein